MHHTVKIMEYYIVIDVNKRYGENNDDKNKPYIVIKKAGATHEYAGVKGTHLPR